jgi:hypothetical protein
LKELHKFYTLGNNDTVFEMSIDFLKGFFTIYKETGGFGEPKMISACLSCTLSIDEKNNSAFIVIQFQKTSSQVQGKGLGTELVVAIQKFASKIKASQNFKEVYLTVCASQESQPYLFYEKCGFIHCNTDKYLMEL